MTLLGSSTSAKTRSIPTCLATASAVRLVSPVIVPRLDAVFFQVPSGARGIRSHDVSDELLGSIGSQLNARASGRRSVRRLFPTLLGGPSAGGLADQVVALGDVRGSTGGFRVRRGGAREVAAELMQV